MSHINYWERSEDAPEDESRFRCACGDPGCWGDGTDSANLNLNGAWYSADCPMARRLDAIAEGRDLASRADVARDDDFNGVRR